MNTYLQQTDK